MHGPHSPTGSYRLINRSIWSCMAPYHIDASGPALWPHCGTSNMTTEEWHHLDGWCLMLVCDFWWSHRFILMCVWLDLVRYFGNAIVRVLCFPGFWCLLIRLWWFWCVSGGLLIGVWFSFDGFFNDLMDCLTVVSSLFVCFSLFIYLCPRFHPTVHCSYCNKWQSILRIFHRLSSLQSFLINGRVLPEWPHGKNPAECRQLAQWRELSSHPGGQGIQGWNAMNEINIHQSISPFVKKHGNTPLWTREKIDWEISSQWFDFT